MKNKFIIAIASIVGIIQIIRIFTEFNIDAVTILLWNIWMILIIFGYEKKIFALEGKNDAN